VTGHVPRRPRSQTNDDPQLFLPGGLSDCPRSKSATSPDGQMVPVPTTVFMRLRPITAGAGELVVYNHH
jgi:hypothetical protein